MATVQNTATIRVAGRTLKKLDRLARAKDQSRTAVVSEAVEHLIDYDKWFASEVRAGLRDLENDRLIDHHPLVKKLERRREASMDARRRFSASFRKARV